MLIPSIAENTEFRRLETIIMEIQKEKNVLLHELAHRTRNNMQFIISLLDMQTSTSDDPVLNSSITKARNRIHSMALVQSQLYESDNLSRISFAGFIYDLIFQLRQCYCRITEKISFDIQTDEIEIAIDVAIPCGLILNELLTNSIVHAFPERKGGRISIHCRHLERGSVELVVHDDGVGAHQVFEPVKNGISGLKLIRILVEDQLDGTVHFDISNGTSCTIVFKNT